MGYFFKIFFYYYLACKSIFCILLSAFNGMHLDFLFFFFFNLRLRQNFLFLDMGWIAIISQFLVCQGFTVPATKTVSY